MNPPNKSRLFQALTQVQEQQFLRQGFVKLESVFPKAAAEEACTILWRESGCDPEKPATWTRPVVRIGRSKRSEAGRKQPQMNADLRGWT